jgi:hypothetical protein
MDEAKHSDVLSLPLRDQELFRQAAIFLQGLVLA